MEVKVATATIKYTEVDAADTSQTVHTFYTAPNIYVLQLFARVKTAFAGVTAPTVALGVSSHAQKYMATQPIDKTGDLCTTVGAGTTAPCKIATSYQKTPANINVVATFTSSSGNFTSLSAGEIEFVMVYVE